MVDPSKPADKLPGGAVIRPYGNEMPIGLAPGRQETADEIDRFLLDLLGEPVGLYIDPLPRHVFVSVTAFPPMKRAPWTLKRSSPMWTLVTTGMSDAHMRIPDQHAGQALPLAELVMRLPPGWHSVGPQGEMLALPTSRQWPVTWLQEMARMPHAHDSWFGIWHSVALPPPMPGSPFVGAVLFPVSGWPKNRQVLSRGDGQKVQFMEVVPLHQAEMECVKDSGLAALMKHFDVEFAADPSRRSVI